MKASLFTDGGARGNPGPAGIGGVLTFAGRKKNFKECIGKTTNNVAEYKALIAGMLLARKNNVGELACYLDSELIVKQLKREYKVKSKDLKPLFDRTMKLSLEFNRISWEHVPREKNKQADKLVNEALDEQE